MRYLKLYEGFIDNQDKNVQLIEDYFISVLDMGFTGGTGEMDDVTNIYFEYSNRSDVYQLLYQSKESLNSLDELKNIIDKVIEELDSSGRKIISKCEKFSFYTYICERDEWDSDYFYKGSVFEKNDVRHMDGKSREGNLFETLKDDPDKSYSIFIRLFIDKPKLR